MTRAAFAVAAIAAFASPLHCQDSDPVFKSATSLVRVDLEVTNTSGAILTGFTQSDFRVFDDGQERPIAAFSFEAEPLDLILLFDLSGGMKSKLLQLVRAVELGFHELKTGDRVCVMTFQKELNELSPFMSDLDAVNQIVFLQVPGLRYSGTSSPEPAASGAARRFLREPAGHRRRAILMITDRVNAFSQAAVRDLWKSDAVLSELVISNAPETSISERSAAVSAEKTGGAAIVAGPPGPSFQQAVRLLRRRYTLYFSSPGGQSGSTERRVEIRLASDSAKQLSGARLRYRTGYTVP